MEDQRLHLNANAPALRSTQQLRRVQPHEPAYGPGQAEFQRAGIRLRQAVTSAIHTQWRAVTSAIHTQVGPAERHGILASVRTLARRKAFESVSNGFFRHLHHQSSGVLPPDARQQFELWYRPHIQRHIAQLVQVMTHAATTSLLRAIRQAGAAIRTTTGECHVTTAEKAIFNILDAPGGFSLVTVTEPVGCSKRASSSPCGY